jgi:hypothetical protein
MEIVVSRDRRIIVDAGGGLGAGSGSSGAAMIPVSSGVRVWIAAGHTDMRCGMNSLAVAGPLASGIALLITKMVCQLRAQRPLDSAFFSCLNRPSSPGGWSSPAALTANCP